MIKEVHALYILAKLSGEPKNPEGPQRPMVSKTSQTEAKETARNVSCKETQTAKVLAAQLLDKRDKSCRI